MNLRDVPIRRKLTIVIMLTSSVVLLLTSAAFITYEVVTFRSGLFQNAQAMAQIIAANSTAALSFDDDRAAMEILSKLRAERTILRAALYDRDGRMLARYPTEQNLNDFPDTPGKVGNIFEGGALRVFFPVHEGNARVGTLYLRTDLTPMYDRFRLYALIVIGVMIGSLLVALALSNWLQKRISGPILGLAETARSVSIQKDYLVRAEKYGADEIGLLTDAFNHMLTEIHDRDLALRQSEERLRLALEASRTGAWDWNVESGITRWDNSVHRLHGLQPGKYDSRQETWLKLVHPEDRAAVSQALQRAMEGGSEFRVEYRVVWPDKTVHYLATRGKAFHNEQGKPVRVSGVTLDITEARAAAEAVSLLAAIVESSDDAIVGKDLDGKIVSWNSGAEKLFGYTAREVIGKTSDLFVPRDKIAEEVRSLARIQDGRIEHYESARLRKDGSLFHASITMSPIKNAEGKIIGASASSRDISDRIRAEEQIRTLNMELEERVLTRTSELATTNKELEAFTYSVSHDLRAPLRHIDAFAQMLEEEIKANLTPTTQKYIGRIRNGVQSMGRLVDDLLNLSHVGRSEMMKQKVSLNAVVDEVLAEMKPEFENRQIEWRIGNLPLAECDPGLIKQVFTNLISNSVKYTRKREKAVIQVDQEQVDDEMAIFVRDNGVGFNMKYAEKLFGVFQRLHRAEEFEGTGVGLATVQRIVHLHEGRVWAEAELDKGATFYFTLKGIQPNPTHT